MFSVCSKEFSSTSWENETLNSLEPYRIVVTGGMIESDLFQLSEPGTVFHDLYMAKMDPFNDGKTHVKNFREGLDLLITSDDKFAFLVPLEGKM